LSRNYKGQQEIEAELSSLIHDLTRLVESGKDPLDFDVSGKLRRLSELIDRSMNFSHLELDTEALYRLALLIYGQSKSLKDRSSILYVDPFLIRLAITGASPDRLAQAFLRAWSPVTCRDVLNPEMMKNSFIYWSSLKRYEIEERESEIISGKDLKSLGVGYEELMTDEVENLYEELKQRGGKASYDELVGQGNLTDRLRRAVLVSFMLSYGYARILKEPLQKKIWVVARNKPEQHEKGEKESLVMIVK